MTIELDMHHIVEIVRPIERGMTEPTLCVLDDDNLYCVKGLAALAGGKISEVISAIVGKKIGLPIPDICIATLSDGLNSIANTEPALKPIGTEPAFCSLWIQHSETFKISMQYNFSKSILAKLFVFDQWIMNGDRVLTEYGGNVNLMTNLVTKDLIVIDHNLAFSESFWSDDPLIHVGYPAWKSLKEDALFLDELKEQMIWACDSVARISDVLPKEWLEQAPDLVDSALNALARVSTQKFWDDLP